MDSSSNKALDVSSDSIKQFRPKKALSYDKMTGLVAPDDENEEEWLKDAKDVIELKRGALDYPVQCFLIVIIIARWLFIPSSRLCDLVQAK